MKDNYRFHIIIIKVKTKTDIIKEDECNNR